MVDTFFEGSASQVMAALLDHSAKDLDDVELARLRKLVGAAAKGKK